MSRPRSSDRQTLTVSQAEAIDAICDQLEHAWKSGRGPALEELLEQHAGPELPREALLAELLAIELAYRNIRGEHPVLAEYQARFPEDLELISVTLQANSTRERLAAGTVLGHYRVESLVGSGGMGEVYRTRDLRLDREVAIKVLRGPLATDGAALERFAQEARALAALSHANILTIHDFGRDHGVSYFVMELLEGESLRDRLHRGPLSWREAAQLTIELAGGLAVAHAKGVVHRDLKPGNIFLPANGGVKILDFGLAQLEAGETPSIGSYQAPAGPLETDPGVVVGTRPYMSPEQIGGEEVDGRSDIYAVGCILFEMVTGRRYFEHPSLEEFRAPPGILEVLQRCLAEEPAQRHQTAAALAQALQSAIRVRRLDVASIAVGLLAGLLAVGGLIAVSQYMEEPATPPRAAANSERDEHYRRGQKYLDAESKESLQKAIAAFESAIEQDGKHALSYAGLANVYLALSSTHLPPAQAMPKAREAAERALLLEPQLAEAHAALAVVRHRWVWDLPGAEIEYRRALEADPRSASAHQWYGRFLMLSGRFAEARAQLARARELEPLLTSIDTDLAISYYYERKYDQALGQFLQVLAVKPESFMARWGLGEVRLMKGDLSRAITELNAARRLDDDPEVLGELGHAHALAGDRAQAVAILHELRSMRASKSQSYVSPCSIAVIHVGLGEMDAAIDWLQEAVSERDEWLVYLGVDPVFDRLRDDERFRRLLQRIGL